MFPFRDNVPSRTYPFVTNGLVWLNILIYVYQTSLGRGAEEFIRTWGLVPAHLFGGDLGAGINPVVTIFTSMFLHGSWFHVLGNMWFLYLFGDNVEDRLGHWRYLWFYLFGGVVAALAHVAFSVNSTVPTVGASGAVAAVLGAYLILYPRARVATLLWFGFFIDVIELPALTFLGYWFLIQLISGLLSLPMGEMGGGVAWWAHVGGFLSGVVFIRFLCTECALARHQEESRPYYR